jgi:ubiquinone/menaquinone biosynthesis C-methylase UbiE
MNDPAHVAAYAESGRVNGLMAAANLFHTAQVSQSLVGCELALDLGCGPGTQLVQVAELNPDVRFVGVDLAENMLNEAQRYASSRNVQNITWHRGDICALTGFEADSFDAVISTMTLHHLPSRQHLDHCFEQINRVLKPGGALYLADFGHLKCDSSISHFVGMHKDTLPPEVCLDYEHSLRAAFEVRDFRDAAYTQLSFPASVYATFLVPLLVIVKTPTRSAPSIALRDQLTILHNRLSPRYRRELHELCLFFRLSGLRSDGFAWGSE